jgi:DNA uptake protein ComE-like DNA-binding protein
MRLSTVRLAHAGTATLLTLGLAACGGSTTSGGTTPSVPAAASSAAAAASSAAGAAGSAVNSAGSAAGSAVNSARKVSANTASEEEITAALTAAGVSNPGRWAEEVVEYRPYPTDDPNLTKLRDNLAKYNPGQETVDKIVSALEP